MTVINLFKPKTETVDRYIDIKYYRTVMADALLKARCKEDKALYDVFKRKTDYTKQLDEDLHLRLNGQISNFFTMFIEGQQGTFKSSVGLSILSRHDPTFKAVRVCFQYQEFQDKLAISKQKESFQLDEEVFKHGTGSRRLIEGMQSLIETLRKRQNSMVIVSPERKYFAESLFTYVLEPIDSKIVVTCKHNRKPHETRTCRCYMEKKFKVLQCLVRSVVKQRGYYLGFYIAPIEWSSKLWDEYSIKKDEFNEKVVQQKHQSNDYEGYAKTALADPDIGDYKTKKQLRLFVEKKYPYLTVGESELVIEAIRVERKKEDGLITSIPTSKSIGRSRTNPLGNLDEDDE